MSLKAQSAGIEIENVDLSYGQTRVLKDVSLSIRQGEFFAFLGPSGCGKTTLLRLIAGFNTCQSGRVLIGGKDVSALPPWKRDVGMVFQSYALWPHMSVARNVAFGLEERRLPRDQIEDRVDSALDIVGLKHLKDRKPSQLSGGQQQRVALARTIAVRPKVLLLDEPLSNLDARMRVDVRRELRALQQDLKLTTVFVTHDQEEANTISDRIAVMQDGRVQQVGTPQELYDAPANLFVAGFLGTANILAAERQADGRASLPGGVRIDLPDDGRTRAMFRPQNARLATPGDSVSTGRARLTGTISHREFLGSTVRYGVRVGASECLVDAPHHGGEQGFRLGDPVAVDVDRNRILWLAD
ncbi:MAG TPA: ABC transporter ATP-binding protein [Beijerinckiaceae bacterium]|nr:ABC transporter ATP-binding protein [Beijerinckiaceae bacterium]